VENTSPEGKFPIDVTPPEGTIPPAFAALTPGGASTPGPVDQYTQRTKDMLEAAEKGRISLLMDYIKQGASINDKDDQGQTALHKAAAAGHKSAVVTVLAFGGELNERDNQGRTALMHAAAEGNSEIVSLLNSPDAVLKLAQDALGGVAANLNLGLGSLTTRLTAAGSSQLELTDKQGRTALMLAAAGGHEDCVKSLLSYFQAERKAQLDKADRKGQNVLMIAAAAGHTNVVDLLLNRGQQGPGGPGAEYLNTADHANKTALDLAQDAGHAPVVKLLEVELGLYAAAAGDVEAVEAARAKYPEQLTPPVLMQRAAQWGSVAVVEHLKERYREKSSEEKLRLMNATGQNSAGGVLTPALMSGNPAVVKAVLDRKWWNDEEARKTLIDFSSPGASPILKSDWYRQNRAEGTALIEAARKECEEKQE